MQRSKSCKQQFTMSIHPSYNRNHICLLKCILLLPAFDFITATCQAQNLTEQHVVLLQDKEKTLMGYAKDMIFAPLPADRFAADSVFIRQLVQCLKTPYSFYFPFDSIRTVAKLYASDSSFRIFTWQIQRDEAYFRQYGMIQMNMHDGSLKLFPLIDVSDFVAEPIDSVRSNKNWIGAIYYSMVEKEFAGKKYYTLLGYDDNDFTSTRKWIEVLSFNSKGEPEFGGSYFEYPADGLKPEPPVSRMLIEFKKDAGVRITYDPELDLIMMDHLISLENTPEKKYTLVPDGDYEAFEWKMGKWHYVEKVFTEKLQDGQAPVPVPLFDDKE